MAFINIGGTIVNLNQLQALTVGQDLNNSQKFGVVACFNGNRVQIAVADTLVSANLVLNKAMRDIHEVTINGQPMSMSS